MGRLARSSAAVPTAPSKSCNDVTERDFFCPGVLVSPVFLTADPSPFLGMTREGMGLLRGDTSHGVC